MRTLAVFAAGLLLAACSTGTRYEFQAAGANDPQARISFVQYHGIYDWDAVSDHQLYVQDAGRQWYQVDLFGPCIGLEYTDRVRFLPSDGAGSFDRFSSIVMKGQRCKVESVKKVAPPMKVAKTHAAPPRPGQT